MVRSTIEDNRHFYIFNDIDPLRDELAKNKNVIDVVDLGSGSHVSKSNQRTISSIYHSAVSGKSKSELLFRIALWVNPDNILELGTSLGISSLYLHHAAPRAELMTLEGCPNVYEVGKNHLSTIPKIKHINTDFDSYLDSNSSHKYDLVYIDGNHQLEATMKYAKALRKSLTSRAVIIFDDIYWSRGMTQAWQQIKSDRIFDSTVDMYQFGLGIIHPQVNTYEDIVVISQKYKPWSLLSQKK